MKRLLHILLFLSSFGVAMSLAESDLPGTIEDTRPQAEETQQPVPPAEDSVPNRVPQVQGESLITPAESNTPVADSLVSDSTLQISVPATPPPC